MPNAGDGVRSPTAGVSRIWACSSAWLERTPDKREVGSSSLPRPTIFAADNLDEPHQNGGVAQLGERLLCKQEVIGSIPFTSTIFFIGLVVKKKFGIGIQEICL